jgi:DNA-binding GntR family transcriptional regulator
VTVASPITGLGASIQRQSTTEQAAEAVRQAILSGRLLPGMPLRAAALAAELGISRSTLREVARTLESGPVRYQMNRGIVVADITGPGAADIYAARAAVELAAADALTGHRDPAVYASLADLLAQRKELAHRKEREAPRG